MSKTLHKRSDFIKRSMLSALVFLKDATLSEEYANRKGFLQSLDPRIKTISLLAFLVTMISLKSAVLIGTLYGFCLILAFSSSIPIRHFLGRTLFFIPFFSLCIVLPTLFSTVTPGDPVCSFNVLGINGTLTRPGIDGALLFVVRIATSVSLVVLLSLTTRHSELLKVLRIFGIPYIFVLTVSMCYRYLYIFATMVENIFTAVKSRVGVVSHHRHGQNVVAWNIANTWNRTTQMSEEVYMAMLSRGYTGEPRLLSQFYATPKDWVWLLSSLIICAGLFYSGHIL
ncbi:MAG: cobalt ECF transporter T component CbiQ [Chlorobiaceae bacterium]|nr:cobalt ECF transporter T component CbiQ [Chlorobiaceae bacterium]